MKKSKIDIVCSLIMIVMLNEYSDAMDDNNGNNNGIEKSADAQKKGKNATHSPVVNSFPVTGTSSSSRRRINRGISANIENTSARTSSALSSPSAKKKTTQPKIFQTPEEWLAYLGVSDILGEKNAASVGTQTPKKANVVLRSSLSNSAEKRIRERDTTHSPVVNSFPVTGTSSSSQRRINVEIDAIIDTIMESISARTSSALSSTSAEKETAELGDENVHHMRQEEEQSHMRISEGSGKEYAASVEPLVPARNRRAALRQQRRGRRLIPETLDTLAPSAASQTNAGLRSSLSNPAEKRIRERDTAHPPVENSFQVPGISSSSQMRIKRYYDGIIDSITKSTSARTSSALSSTSAEKETAKLGDGNAYHMRQEGGRSSVRTSEGSGKEYAASIEPLESARNRRATQRQQRRGRRLIPETLDTLAASDTNQTNADLQSPLSSSVEKQKTDNKKKTKLKDERPLINIGGGKIPRCFYDNLNTSPEFKELQDVMVEVYREHYEALRVQSGLRTLLDIKGDVSSHTIAEGLNRIGKELNIVPPRKSKGIDVAIYNLKIIQYLADSENLMEDAKYALQVLFAHCVQNIRKECLLNNIGSDTDANNLMEIVEDIPNDVAEYEDVNWKQVLGTKEAKDSKGLNAVQLLALQMNILADLGEEEETNDTAAQVEFGTDEEEKGKEILNKVSFGEGLGPNKDMSIVEYIRQINDEQIEGGQLIKGKDSEVNCKTLATLIDNILENIDQSAIAGLLRVIRHQSLQGIKEAMEQEEGITLRIYDLVDKSRKTAGQHAEEQASNIKRIIDELCFMQKNLLGQYVMTNSNSYNADVKHLRDVLFRKYAIVIRDWCNDHIMSNSDEQYMCKEILPSNAKEKREPGATFTKPIVLQEGGIDWRDVLASEGVIPAQEEVSVDNRNGCGNSGIWGVVGHQKRLRTEYEKILRTLFQIIPQEMGVEEFLESFDESTRKSLKLIAMKPFVLRKIFDTPGVKWNGIKNFTQLTARLMDKLYNSLTPSLQKALVASSFGRVFDLRVFSELAQFLAKDYLPRREGVKTDRDRCLDRVVSIMFSPGATKDGVELSDEQRAAAVRNFLNIINGVNNQKLFDLEDEKTTFPRLSLSKEFLNMAEMQKLIHELSNAREECTGNRTMLEQRYAEMDTSYNSKVGREAALWIEFKNQLYEEGTVEQGINWTKLEKVVNENLNVTENEPSLNINGTLMGQLDVMQIDLTSKNRIEEQIVTDLNTLRQDVNNVKAAEQKYRQKDKELQSYRDKYPAIVALFDPASSSNIENYDWSQIIEQVNRYNAFVDALYAHMEATNLANKDQEKVLFSEVQKKSGVVDNQITLGNSKEDGDAEMEQKLVEEKEFLPNASFVSEWRALTDSENGVFALNSQTYNDALMTYARCLALTPEWQEARAVQIALSDPKSREFVKKNLVNCILYLGNYPGNYLGNIGDSRQGNNLQVFNLLNVLLEPEQMDEIRNCLKEKYEEEHRGQTIDEEHAKRLIGSIGKKILNGNNLKLLWEDIKFFKNLTTTERKTIVEGCGIKYEERAYPSIYDMEKQNPQWRQRQQINNWKNIFFPLLGNTDRNNFLKGAIRSILQIEDEIYQDCVGKKPATDALNELRAIARKKINEIKESVNIRLDQDQQELEDTFIAQALQNYVKCIIRGESWNVFPETYDYGDELNWRLVPLDECVQALYFLRNMVKKPAQREECMKFLTSLTIPVCRNLMYMNDYSINWRKYEKCKSEFTTKQQEKVRKFCTTPKKVRDDIERDLRAELTQAQIDAFFYGLENPYLKELKEIKENLLAELQSDYNFQEMIANLFSNSSRKEREFDYDSSNAEAVCLLNYQAWIEGRKPTCPPDNKLPMPTFRNGIKLSAVDMSSIPEEYLVWRGSQDFSEELLTQARNYIANSGTLRESLRTKMKEVRAQAQKFTSLIYFVPGIAMRDTTLPGAQQMRPYMLLSSTEYRKLNPILRRKLMDFIYITSVEYMLQHLDAWGRHSGQYAAFLDLESSPKLKIGYNAINDMQNEAWSVNSDNSKYSISPILGSMPRCDLIFSDNAVDEKKLKYVLRYYLLRAIYLLATRNLELTTATAFPSLPPNLSNITDIEGVEEIIDTAHTAVTEALNNAKVDKNVPKLWQTGDKDNPYPELAVAMQQNGDSGDEKNWDEAIEKFESAGAFGGIANMLQNIKEGYVEFPNLTSAAIALLDLIRQVDAVQEAIDERNEHSEDADKESENSAYKNSIRKINKRIGDISGITGSLVSRFGHCGDGRREGVSWFIHNRLSHLLESRISEFADLNALISFVCNVVANNLIANVLQFTYRLNYNHTELKEAGEAASKGSEAIKALNGFGNSASEQQVSQDLLDQLRINIMRSVVGFFVKGSGVVDTATVNWYNNKIAQIGNENLRSLIDRLPKGKSAEEKSADTDINTLIDDLEMENMAIERLKAYCAVYKVVTPKNPKNINMAKVMECITRAAVNARLLAAEVSRLSGEYLFEAFRQAYPEHRISKANYNQLNLEDRMQLIFDILVDQGYIRQDQASK